MVGCAWATRSSPWPQRAARPQRSPPDIREARGTGSRAWVTAHNPRKTTATNSTRRGLSARQVADQLGYARVSITQDVYLGRRLASRRAADALAEAFSDAWKDEKHE